MAEPPDPFLMAAHAAAPSSRLSTTRTEGAAVPWFARPWAIALAVAVPLAIAYLMAAAGGRPGCRHVSQRSIRARRLRATRPRLVRRPGHYLLGYSLLSPALGALVGVRLGARALGARGERTVRPDRRARLRPRRRARRGRRVRARLLRRVALRGAFPTTSASRSASVGARAAAEGASRSRSSSAILTSAGSPVAGAFLALAGLAYALARAEKKPGRTGDSRSPAPRYYRSPSSRSPSPKAATSRSRPRPSGRRSRGSC